MTNNWIPNPGTGVIPVREGETLVAVRLQDGSENISDDAEGWQWSRFITHYQVSPPRRRCPADDSTCEYATMSADEVLIRAREAAIELCLWPAAEVRGGDRDDYLIMKAIIAYERDRAKPLAEVAPHTAEDPDERVAYDMYVNKCGYHPFPWEKREDSPWYVGILAGIKRGRELERGA